MRENNVEKTFEVDRVPYGLAVHDKEEEEFDIANNITRNSFLIGCNHGLTENHINKIKNCFTEFISKY